MLFALLFALVAVAACAPSAADGGAPVNDGNSADAVDTDTGKTTVYIDEIELLLMESFPVQVAAIVRGNLANGCVVLDGISAIRSGEGFALDVRAHEEGDFCTQSLVPFEERVTLDVLGLKAGTYTVRAGEISAEFTFDVDNGSANAPSADSSAPDGASVEYIQDLRGTVTAVEIGKDGLQAELTSGETVYSVTISVMQAEIFGRFEGIRQGAELVVSGPVVAGMEPPLIVAEKIEVVESGSDYVRNLRGTVTEVQPGPEGLRAEMRADNGTTYVVTFDPTTTEIVYLDANTEIRPGTPVLVSGELFCLLQAQFSPRIAAEVAVVRPAPQL